MSAGLGYRPPARDRSMRERLTADGLPLCESLDVTAYPWKGVIETSATDCRDVATRIFVWSNGDAMALCEDHYAEFMFRKWWGL